MKMHKIVLLKDGRRWPLEKTKNVNKYLKKYRKEHPNGKVVIFGLIVYVFER